MDNSFTNRDDIAIGIQIPFGSGQSNFKLNYTTLDQARSNIINLLLTHKGERFMQPEFGTNLRRFIFKPNTRTLESAIKTELTSTISFWLPYVNLDDIQVTRSVQQIEDYTIAVSLTFSVSSDITEFKTVTFGFDSSGGVSVRG
tara:strand:+ start:232 stop:663 length:432 start_codon:yes stop_codon:yes gene_type:complete